MQRSRHSDQFWTEVQQTCEALNSDIYLPTDLEAHLRRTLSERNHSQSYHRKLRVALDPVDNIFCLENGLQSADESFVEFDNQLKVIEDKLQSIVSSLEQSASAVRDSADSLANAKRHAVHASHAVKHISGFVDALSLPDDIHNTLTVCNPHSCEFKHALAVLSRFFSTSASEKDALSVREAMPSANSIRHSAIRRIDERFRESFLLMKEPSSSFTILRDTLLLQQRPLIDFLKDHARHLFDWLGKEYVQVAKLAFDFQVRSFYDQLSSCPANPTKPISGSSFVGSNATRLLSSLWDYSSSFQQPREDDDEAAVSEHLTDVRSLEQVRKGMSDLSNECMDVLHRALDPPLTTAEVHLMETSPALSFSGLFLQLVSFFLKYEKCESRFLVELFANEGKIFLGEIFSPTENPVLECLDLSMQFLQSEFEVEQLCLSLYLCRRIRENIKTHQELDHRISFCVIAERVLQTQFASQLDSRTALARKLLLKEIEGRTTNVMSYNAAAWFSVSIARCLQTVRLGDEWISSRDMGYAFRRRLFSSVNGIVSLAESIQAKHSNVGIGIKSCMRFVVSFLFAIDTCKSLEKEKCETTEEIRALVQSCLLSVCDSYAKSYENTRLQQISQIERCCGTSSFEECLQFMAVLVKKYDNIEHFIREDIRFLRDDPTDGIYEDQAVNHILSSLLHRMESVKVTLSSNYPKMTTTTQWQKF